MRFQTPWVTGLTPRTWQIEAFAAAEHHLGFNGEPAVIRAIMGAGKSILIAELCACADLLPMECIVVSTPTELLVRQILEDISRRCGMQRRLGYWYGKGKKVGQVIVTCIPSVPSLAEALNKCGMKCALWIADEAHRSECETMLTGSAALAPALSLGFTATPYRACDKETLSLFRHQLYDYNPDRALSDGVVVPWRIESWTGGEIGLDAACVEMIRGAPGPGIANARSISDADEFATLLTAEGIPAECIHSKIPSRKQHEIIERLRERIIRCIVHVNMLAEGANFPWLRWLCLRREVDSRVRFLQEAGRVLRAYPGKEEAIFFDPHDLFGSFQISYAEALGERRETVAEVQELGPEERATAINNQERSATALTLAELEIRRLTVACDASGMLADRRIMAKQKRREASTPLQIKTIAARADSAKVHAPASWHALMDALSKNADMLSRGFAADFISSLSGILWYKRWPPLDDGGRIYATTGAAAPSSAAPNAVAAAAAFNGRQELIEFEGVQIP